MPCALSSHSALDLRCFGCVRWLFDSTDTGAQRVVTGESSLARTKFGVLIVLGNRMTNDNFAGTCNHTHKFTTLRTLDIDSLVESNHRLTVSKREEMS